MSCNKPEHASGSHGNQSHTQSLTGTVAELSSSKPHRVQKALILIRTQFLKEKDGISRLRQRGGLSKLMPILEGDSEKLIDITLSILGNCCMDHKFRQEILKQDGNILKIGKLLEKTQVSSIHNRVCRTLANLALDPQCCAAIHQLEEFEVVKRVVELLKNTTEAECQQTYLRTLRLLADTKDHQDSALEEGALKASTELLKSEEITVIMAALKAVNHFTKEITEEHCRQLVGGEFATSLLQLATHCDRNICQSAMSVILTLIKYESLRPPFGAAGAITFFLDHAQDSVAASGQRLSYINALCLCCRESVNRVRLRDTGALVQMLAWLNEAEFGSIQNRIISSLVCFLYDDVGMTIMLKNDVVPTLVQHLRKCASISENSNILVNHSGRDPEDKESTKEEEPLIVPASAEDPLQLEVGNPAGMGNQRKMKEENCVVDDIKICVEAATGTETDVELEVLQETVSKRAPIKYSIDSPTYKEMMESHRRDDDDQSGPRNIMEAKHYSYGQSSPGKLSPYQSPHHGGSYSPLSVSSYLASDWSPEVSPASSPIHCHSPISFTASQESTSRDPFTTGAGPALSLPQWSPAQGSSPSASQLSSVSYISPMSSPPHPQVSPFLVRSHSSPSLWSPLHSVTYDAHFSSSEEEESAVSHAGESDTVPGPGLDEDVFPSFLFEVEALPSTSETHHSVEGDSTSEKSGITASGRKRKHSLTADAQLKIQRKVEEHSRTPSSVSLESLLSDTKSTKIEKVEGELSKIKGPQKITEYNILILLSRISCLDNPSKYLTSKTVWTALLAYARRARDPIYRGLRIMVRLTKNPHCFRDLISSGIPELIDWVLCPLDQSSKDNANLKSAGDEPSKCKDLNDTRQLRDQLLDSLSILAESPFGRGILTNLMMRGSSETQLHCAVSLAFICRSSALRDDVLISCGALDALIDGLSKSAEHGVIHRVTFEMVVHAISHLASACDDTHDHGQHFRSGSKTPQIRVQKSRTEVSLDLTFELDDGHHVRGQRELLVSRSSIFKAMLQGHYSESKQSVIRIQNVSSEAFQLFLSWIHNEATEPPADSKLVEQEHLAVLLEVLALCDQYLLPDVQQKVSEYVCVAFLSADNALKVVECALIHNNMWLARQGLLYVATHPVPQKCLQMFRDLALCGHGSLALQELRNSLAL